MTYRLILNILYLFTCTVLLSCTTENSLIAPGISEELAAHRRSTIKKVTYHLDLDIPAQKQQPITGEVTINFDLHNRGEVILDFNAPAEKIKSIDVNGNVEAMRVEMEHVIISSEFLKNEGNTVKINFEAGDQSLNRKEDYLYTLFVPERASTCFPLFDQPDLKAKYNLRLTIPSEWNAISNSEVYSTTRERQRTTYVFKETPRISSYLFSFATGKFKVESRDIGGRTMRMFHRETDSLKLHRNIDVIFDWHKESLDWLEAYTGIAYPFKKFDFVLIPSFQYGGMEHPGAILYKAESLLLDESSTLNKKLSRARLIAHETSHMWFGDLVTMRWFDDVWLKEVFANFMAAKIVNPGFPDVNHDLQFLMAHYPAAYEVDRTKGTHPVQQPLANLKDAGTLYGSIIYHKAPIVMQMLEHSVGKDSLQHGLQQYLKKYAFKNADWDDLIQILDAGITFDLERWNDRWVKQPGMPTIFYKLKSKNKKTISSFTLWSRDEYSSDVYACEQDIEVMMGNADSSYTVPARMLTDPRSFSLKNHPNPEHIFTNAGGLGYGYFQPGPKTKEYLLANIDSIDNPVLRGAVWIDLYETMLREALPPEKLMSTAVSGLLYEKEALIAEYITRVIETIYWKFYTAGQRTALAPRLEGLLLNLAIHSSSEDLKSTYFQALNSIAISKNGVELLKKFWNKEMQVEGLTLSEKDYTELAYALAVRGLADYKEILNAQLTSISNPDRRDKFKFVMQALSNDPSERDAFFESLRVPENRENEDWALEALSYLHHPLRAENSVHYIQPGLEMLQEVQLSGDIFFPKRWLEATLAGHSSEEAAEAVRQFLYSHNKYPENLKQKILQSSDLLFRVVKIKEKSG